MTVTNSTVSGNSASRQGGGISNDSTNGTNDAYQQHGERKQRHFDGGGMVNADNSTVNLFNVTITDNLADPT